MAKSKRRKSSRKVSGRARKAVRRKGTARRKSSYIRAGRKGHIKRGCGKRNWRRGGNAHWRCRVGKQHAYGKRKVKKTHKRRSR